MNIAFFYVERHEVVPDGHCPWLSSAGRSSGPASSARFGVSKLSPPCTLNACDPSSTDFIFIDQIEKNFYEDLVENAS
jgi:hypothetical protein